MRVLLDGTALLGTRTGVGRYTSHVLAELAALAGADDPAGAPGVSGTAGDGAAGAGAGSASEWRIDVTAFTWRGRAELPGVLPAGVGARGPRVPARLLHELWARTELPRVAWLAGRSDVVHGPNFVLPPPGRAAGVVTVHDLSYLRVPGTVSSATARYRELVPRSLRRAQVVLTPSEAIAAEVRDTYRLEPDRVVATPLGVEEAWFATGPLPSLASPPSLPERYLLFVGTLEPRKDLPTLLAAYRMLLDDEPSRPDVPPLVLVGPPGWGPALNLAGIPPDRVIATGYLAEPALRPVVAGAVALCFPSLYEGFGLPPLEALAAGTPVVASDIAATREVVGALDGGDSGAPEPRPVRLVPPGDAAALALALQAASALPRPDPEPGRRHARGYTWRSTALRTLESYRRAVTLRN